MPSLHIAAHLIRRTMGTRRGLLMNVLLPAAILSVMAGLFAGLQGGKPVIVVNNADAGPLGAYLAAAVENESLYDVRRETDWDEQAVKDAVEEGGADAAIYVPTDFTQQIAGGGDTKAILYRLDEQLWNASLAMLLEAETSRLAASASIVRGAGGGGTADAGMLAEFVKAQQSPAVTADNVSMKLGRVLSEPMVIGLMLMFVMLLLGQTIGFVLEDREKRTMARMFTAPLRAIDIAVGNFAGSLIIGSLQLTIVLGLTYFAFGYAPGIPFGSMLLVLECFLLAALGLVSAAAGLVRNRTQLQQLNTLIILPTCMISGCFFPLSMLPDFIQKLANFMPQKWALQAIDRLGGGQGIGEIGLHLAILVLFAAVLLAFGAAVLRPNRT
ncbi:ABC transporter permease [Paenibacillus arenilitoris]|uniref:ABC transporter permease n=1 Tax=Paenibacillus arenilitoris TaxID=2772299 RepID=A0A927CNE4_9BACL|nr:ABC transporter permease [Paenibacillus arenilitoris]MBD2870067.1 ABC transporter permease [Paenibacillus arenilitoris]